MKDDKGQQTRLLDYPSLGEVPDRLASSGHLDPAKPSNPSVSPTPPDPEAIAEI